MSIEDQIRYIAAGFEDVENARWTVWEAIEEIVDAAPPRSPARRERLEAVAQHIGRSKRHVEVWLQAVREVPRDLRHTYLPVGTILWVSQNLAPDEATGWLERCHDAGWSLARLQREIAGAEERNADTLTLRTVMRSIARELPDTPIDAAVAEATQEAINAAIAPYL